MSSSSSSQINPFQGEADLMKSTPPPYASEPQPSLTLKRETVISRSDDPALNILREVDTVILVDDSGSMEGYWEETGKALAVVAAEAAKYDQDGIEIYFLNSKEVGKKITKKTEVAAIFAKVKPRGLTPLGKALTKILDPYINALKIRHRGGKLFTFLKPVKPINILVLTDGEPTDNPKAVIARIALALDELRRPRNQVGLQFVQIGSEEGATEYLRKLDDDLSEEYGVRDMVDTVPTDGREPLSGEQLIKILLGGLSRRFDEKPSH